MSKGHFFFLTLLFIYSAFTTVLLFLFLGKIKKVARYAKKAFEGSPEPGGHRKLRGVFRDIYSSLDEASEKLRASLRLDDEGRNRILAILESMAEGVLVVDPEQRVVLINSMLGRVLGVGGSRAEGRYFWEVFRDPSINEMIHRVLSERVSTRREHTILLTASVFQIQVSPVFLGAELLGAVAVFHDVTQLKELERMRSEFVANVSHELKTPLTSIIGFVETLKEGAVDDKENRMRFLGIIDEHSKKLHTLIDDLLLLSKMESEKWSLETESLDLETMLVKIADLFHTALRAKKMKLSFRISPKPFFIQADRTLMERVFCNLIDNAIKYSRDGGEISVEAFEEAGCSKIRFKDTGIGIPEEDAVRVFERFYRVDRSRSRESGGTGLGLAIVKHVLERHRGLVELESTSAAGSTFMITLPKS